MRRPVAVQHCLECGELAGRGYPACEDCVSAVDGFWLADWQAQEVLARARELDAGPDRFAALAEGLLPVIESNSLELTLDRGKQSLRRGQEGAPRALLRGGQPPGPGLCHTDSIPQIVERLTIEAVSGSS